MRKFRRELREMEDSVSGGRYAAVFDEGTWELAVRAAYLDRH